MELRNITKSYDGKAVLSGVSAVLPDRGVVCITGPSGCGKTTLMRIIARLEKADSGSITGFSPEKQSFIFQEDRLLPWATACENVSFVRDAGCSDYLDMLGIGDAAGKYPSELSGGMCRRVALARMLSHGGDVCFMDEPFTGLDADRKFSVMDIIKRELCGKLAFLITHDAAEAAYMEPAAVIRL